MAKHTLPNREHPPRLIRIIDFKHFFFTSVFSEAGLPLRSPPILLKEVTSFSRRLKTIIKLVHRVAELTHLEELSVRDVAVVVHIVDAESETQFGQLVALHAELRDALDELLEVNLQRRASEPFTERNFHIQSNIENLRLCIYNVIFSLGLAFVSRYRKG